MTERETNDGDRSALVVGGSGAIGTAVVADLAREGFDVVVGYHADESEAHEAAETAREHAVRARTGQADVTDPNDAERLVAETDALAPLSAVAYCAGVTDPHPIEDVDADSFARSLAVNVGGAANVAGPAVERMRERGDGGAFVAVSSVAAETGTVDTSYGASKAGMLGFARSLAREVGADGVRVNAVCPGPVDTPMNDRIVEYLEERRFRGHETVDSLLDRYEARPEEVASAVSFLATHEFVTGETLRVDGGLGL